MKKTQKHTVDLSTLTLDTNISNCTVSEVGTFLFNKRKLNLVNKTYLEKRLKDLDSTGYYEMQALYTIYDSLLIDADKIFMFMSNSGFNFRTFVYLNSFGSSLIDTPEFKNAFFKYVKLQQNKLSKIAASAIFALFPEDAADKDYITTNLCPEGVKKYIDWSKANNSRHKHDKILKGISETLVKIRNKTELRKLLIAQPSLFKYLDNEFIDKSVFTSKDYIYTLDKAKPRALSSEMVSFLETKLFCDTISTELKYTQTLGKTVKRLKDKAK